MGDGNRFFRWLGRINAILFFLGAAAVLLLVAGEMLFSRGFDTGVLHPAADPQAQVSFDFGGNLGAGEDAGSSAIVRFDGTDEGMMVLRREEKLGYGSFGSRGSADGASVNVLLIDLKTMKNRWLFHGVGQDIGHSLFVRARLPVQQGTLNSVVAVLMPVATTDTNRDGKITFADDHGVYVDRPGGAEAVRLLDAKSVSSMEQLDSERVLVTYYDGKVDRVAMLATGNFKVIAETPLPPTPK